MANNKNQQEDLIHLKSHKDGDNITLLNTIYFKSLEINPSEKSTKSKYVDHAILVYKDLDTNLKYKEEIDNPEYIYYTVKDEYKTDYNRLFVSKDELIPHKVKYMDLDYDVAKNSNALDFFFDNIKTGNRYENKIIHTNPNVVGSDMNIEDHLRLHFKMQYQDNPISSPTKSYFDIEVDGINVPNHAVPMDGEAPINAITIILQEQRQVYTLLLRTKANPQIKEFEDSVKDGSIFSDITNFVIEAVGGKEIAEKYKIDFSYNFLFYDEEEEIKLISDLFNIINTYKPDFSMAWNMAYDIPFIIGRIIKLGYSPRDIICHPDFKNKICEYIVDEKMKNEYAERGDYARISSYTVYIDQMIQFASRRKGQSIFKSYSLDSIGEAIAKVRKLDYKDITSDIAELPYKSYKTFVFYNIMDTIVQYCIEFMTNDINYVCSKATANCTRYSKVHRQTRYLTNRGAWEFYKDNFIIGNNANAFNKKPTEKFPGAFVANPAKVNNYSRYKIYGKSVDIFDNDNDFDYSSLYPSIIRQYNIAPNTQIGKIQIIDSCNNIDSLRVYNKAHLEKWTKEIAFMEDIQSQNWIEFCYRWFGLSSYRDLYHEIEVIFETILHPSNGLRTYDRNGCQFVFYDNANHPKYNNKCIEDVFIFDNENHDEKYIKPDKESWNEFMKNKKSENWNA